MLPFYFDEDSMDRSLIESLRLRHIIVESALEAGMIHRPDDDHLRYATEHGRMLYSFNVADFCRIHEHWLRSGKSHAGILLAHQRRRHAIGVQLRALQRLSAELEPAEASNQLLFLNDWI